jgi:alkyldihydroxyacetonephosphate synthase
VIDAERVTVAQEDLTAHGCDAWPVAIKMHQQGKSTHVPEAVVYPLDAQEISDLLKWANKQGVAITPWGAGSAVTGSPLPLNGGITIDLSKLDRIGPIDEHNRMVTVEAGVKGDVLEAHLNERGYALKHSPQSLNVSTAGGWVATLATGQFSSRYGGIEQLIVCLTVVLPCGEIIKTQRAVRAAVGPEIKRLFIGAEGTLGIVTEVTLKIFSNNDHRIYEAVALETIQSGIEVMRQIMHAGLRPFLVRFYDQTESRHAMQDTEFDRCVMFLGFEGDQRVARAEHEVAMELCDAVAGKRLGEAPVLAWMDRRFDFSTVENILAEPSGVAETIEVANFWDSIHQTYIELTTALAPYADEVLGHFSHVYTQGTSLYVILLGKPEPEKNAGHAEATLRKIWEIANRVALNTGAVTSHHHGTGIARLNVINEDLGSSALVLERVKRALDPNDVLCPGKLGLHEKRETKRRSY